MDSESGGGFRPKSPEQLKQQVGSITTHLGQSVVPVSIEDNLDTISPTEIKERSPNRYEAYIRALREIRRWENNIAGNNLQIERPIMMDRWGKVKQLVKNLNNHIDLHKNYGAVEGVSFKERQMTIFEAMRDRIEDGETEGTIQAPTGFGKTVIFNQLVAAADVPTIIIVPTRSLVEQTYKRFKQFTPDIPVGRVYSERKEYGKQVTITTYDSLVSDHEGKLIDPEGIGLVILDESHKAVSEGRIQKVETIDQFKDAVIVGLSATPIKVNDPKFDHTRIARMSKNLWYVVPEREAIEEGYLASFSSIVVEVDVDLSNVRITEKGNYNEEELDHAINNIVQNESAIKFFLQKREEDQNQRQEEGKRPLLLTTAWFSASVEQAKEHARLLQQVGVKAAAVWGTSNPREQAEHKGIMEQWEMGEIEVVCSKDLLIQGLDIAGIRCIMNVAPTASAVVEKQRSGRGLRFDENNPDKEAIIIDFVYKNSNLRYEQVIYPELIGAASIVRRHVSSVVEGNPRYGVGSQRELEGFNIEGLIVTTNAAQIMRITNNMIASRIGYGLEKIDLRTEIGITQSWIRERYIGGAEKAGLINRLVTGQIVSDFPDAAREIIGNNGIKIIALKQEYLGLLDQLMEREGIKLREQVIAIGEDDIPVIKPWVMKRYVGAPAKTVGVVRLAIEHILRDHPDAARESVLSTGNRVTALKQEYLGLLDQLMEREGIKLREQVIAIGEDQIPVARDWLVKRYIGTSKKLQDLSRLAIEHILRDHPDAGKNVITSNGKEVIGLRNEYVELFDKLMGDQGVGLRESANLINEDTELGVVREWIMKRYVGSPTRTQGMVRLAIEHILRDHPDAARESVLSTGNKVTALKQEYLGLLDQLMEREGIKLRVR